MMSLSYPECDYYVKMYDDMLSQFKNDIADGSANEELARLREIYGTNVKSVTDYLLRYVIAPQFNQIFSVFRDTVLEERLTREKPREYDTPLGLSFLGATNPGEWVDENKTQWKEASGWSLLDGIGDVVRLTRREAGLLAGVKNLKIDANDARWADILADAEVKTFLKRHESQGIINMTVIQEDIYRKFLWFKVFLNSSYTTYNDLMLALRILWEDENFVYEENVPSEIKYDDVLHATIMLTAPAKSNVSIKAAYNNELSLWSDTTKVLFVAPMLKAAGVTLIRKSIVEYEQETVPSYAGAVFNATDYETTLPFIDWSDEDA